MNGMEEGSWNERQIQRLLKGNSKKQVTVEEYCLISEQALKAPDKYLLNSFQTMKAEKNINCNPTNLVGFLLKPDISFTVKGKYESKKEEEIKEVGRRIVQTIVSAWDYYLRMMKGIGESKNMPMIYNSSNLQMGRKNIEDMLKELKDKRYYWENYEKNQLSYQEEERKEVEEEETFIKLLDNMLRNQTQKVLAARLKEKGRVENERVGMKNECQPELVKQTRPYGRQQSNDITSVINLKGYFESKRKAEGQARPQPDPISRCEQRRRFNAAVLRYSANNALF